MLSVRSVYVLRSLHLAGGRGLRPQSKRLCVILEPKQCLVADTGDHEHAVAQLLSKTLMPLVKIPVHEGSRIKHFLQRLRLLRRKGERSSRHLSASYISKLAHGCGSGNGNGCRGDAPPLAVVGVQFNLVHRPRDSLGSCLCATALEKRLTNYPLTVLSSDSISCR